MRKYVSIVVLILLNVSFAYSTLQTPDRVIIGNDTIFLRKSPFETENEFNEIIGKIVGDHASSNCWDKFRGEWQIIDNKLYLTDLKSCENGNSLIAEYEKFYGTNKNDKGYLSTWVSGTFWGESGPFIDFDLSSYAETETKLTIRNGIVINRHDWKAKKCFEGNWETYLSEYIYRNINWDLFDESALIRTAIDFYFYTDKNGKIITTEFKIFDFEEKFKDEMIRLLDRLDCWNQYYYYGEPITDLMLLHLEFDHKKKTYKQ